MSLRCQVRHLEPGQWENWPRGSWGEMSCLCYWMATNVRNHGSDYSGSFDFDHFLKKENEKLKKKAELRENILAELSLEQRGNQMVPRAASTGKDDMVPQVSAWEDATLSV